MKISKNIDGDGGIILYLKPFNHKCSYAIKADSTLKTFDLNDATQDYEHEQLIEAIISQIVQEFNLEYEDGYNPFDYGYTTRLFDNIQDDKIESLQNQVEILQ